MIHQISEISVVDHARVTLDTSMMEILLAKVLYQCLIKLAFINVRLALMQVTMDACPAYLVILEIYQNLLVLVFLDTSMTDQTNYV